MEAPTHSQYRKGSIIRIRMHNFLTYTDAEVKPGAKLNLVVGPNGTGKSSVVCAICLCLGGSPKSLERAEKYKDFVKQGHTDGFVEIELYKAGMRDANVTIRMDVTIQDKGTWAINNKRSTRKAVQELMNKLAIQVDNLCCFLAQERVVKFASLDPIRLLQETEKAVDSKLFEYHEILIKKKKEEKVLSEQTVKKEQTLQEKKNEKNGLEKDVKRMEEKKDLEGKIDLLKKKKFWIRYKGLKEVEEQKGAEVKKAQADQEALFDSQKPLRDKVKEAKTVYDALHRKHKNLLSTGKGIRLNQRRILDNLEALENNVVAEIENIEEIKRDARTRQNRIEKKREMVKKLERMVLEFPTREERMKAKAAASKEVSSLKSLRMKHNKEKNHCVYELKATRHRLKSTQVNQNQSQQILRRQFLSYGQKSMEMYQWVSKHRHEFRGRIWGPIFKEIKYESQLHGTYIEQLCGNNVLGAYVVENPQDWDELPRRLKADLGSVRVNVHSIDPSKLNSRPRNRVANLNKFQQYGIKWLDEVVDCEAAVKAALIDLTGMDKVAYTERAVDDTVVDAFMMQKHNRTGITRFLNVNKLHNVSFSRYGSFDRLATKGNMRKPRILVQTVDNGAADRMKREREQLQAKENKLQGRLDDVDNEDRKLEEPMRVASSKLKQVSEQEKRIKKIQRELKMEITALEDLQDNRDRILQEEAEKKIKKYNMKRLTRASDFTKIAKSWALHLKKNSILSLELTQAKFRFDDLNNKFERCREEISQLKNLVSRLEREWKQAQREKAEAKALAKREAPLKKYKEFFQQDWMPNELDLINDKISELEVRVGSVVEDGSIYARYQQLGREIRSLTEETKKMNEELKKDREIIAEKKKAWLPGIKQLVQKVSKSYSRNFSQMGCTGEVRVREDEDFEKYGLEIWVRFRAESELQQLSKHTQSGGERSVSTMLFLLCLQTVTDTPFRVVDEINQGMDSKNERMVFNQIVASCASRSAGPSAPQYFLVTPKLLPNLEYPATADITVLCVYNGYGMVPKEEWNMEAFTKTFTSPSNKRRKIAS